MAKKISETEIVVNNIFFQRVPEIEGGTCTGCAFHLPGNSRDDNCTIYSSKITNNIDCCNSIWVKEKNMKQKFVKINNDRIIMDGKNYERTSGRSNLCHNCAFWDDECTIRSEKRIHNLFCGNDIWTKCEDNPTIMVDPIIDPTIKKALDRMDYLHRRESKKYKLNFD